MNIIHNIGIRAKPGQVIEAVTTAKGLAGWYAPKSKASAKVGSLLEFNFGAYGTITFRLDVLEPGRRAVWVGVDVPPAWQGTRVAFEVTPLDGEVDFTFTHSGLPDPYEDFGNFNYLWGQYVRSLKLFVEAGVGEPFGSAASKAARTTPAEYQPA